MGGLSGPDTLDPLMDERMIDNFTYLLNLKRSLSKTSISFDNKDHDFVEILQEYHAHSKFQFQYPDPGTWNDGYQTRKETRTKNTNNLYIHIPFCRYSCTYCTFPKTIYDEKKVDRYLAFLKKEIELKKDELKEAKKFDTAYIGGGTPSALNISQINTLFNILPDLSNAQEITFESNPDSIDQKKLLLLKKRGVTRISLGVQTFNQNTLDNINRKHRSEHIIEVVKLIKEIGFKINIDMLYGLTDNINSFEKDMETVVSLKPDNITYQKLHRLFGSAITANVKKQIDHTTL
jgi:coproporphyrinogen III oxidase-like Fe-S oxidoreductase